jgi:hypothetical protein
MKRRSSKPSRRLLAAAVAERTEIAKQREALLAQRRTLSTRIDDVDAELAELAERAALIERLAGPSDDAESTSEDDKRSATGDRIILRGPAIRQIAVAVILSDPAQPRVLHYRDWFKLLEHNGYAVEGKDPLAVFLTQISRSPVVHRGTQSGIYEIRLDAADRLRGELVSRQRELRALTSAADGTTDLGDIRARRMSLTRHVNKLEKALEEARTALEPGTQKLAAAG